MPRYAGSQSSNTKQPSSSEDLLFFSKLSPPRLPTLLVERSVLLTRLDNSLHYPLTVLQAPAGFGKTTLVTQWIDARRSLLHFPRVIWLSLDAGDNDPLRFWRSLIRACQIVEATVGQDALARFSQAVQPPFQVPQLEIGVASFLHDLAQLFPDSILILDDYHTITQPQIHESTAFFLDHLPTQLRVMLLSRAEPPLPLLRWRARGAIFSLQRSDLRFSLEETTAFLCQADMPPFPKAMLLQLDAQFSGWAAGLRLLTHSLQGGQTMPEITNQLSSLLDAPWREPEGAPISQMHQQILDYFAVEILQAQPEELQRFLLQTSLFSHLTASLCDAVVGQKEGTFLLKSVERAELFLEVVEVEALHLPCLRDTWYRYHALWASALRREARTRLGEEELHVCLMRASSWYEQHGMLMEAIETALQAQDLARAAQLIEQMDAQGQISEPHTLHRWLSSMPEAVLRAHPMLCWLSALTLHLIQNDASIPQAERGEALLHMAQEGWRERGALSFLGLIDAFHALREWRKGAFSKAVEHAKRALVCFVEDNHYRRIRMFRGLCFFIVGTAQMYEGRFDEARFSLLEAVACSFTDDGREFTRSLPLLLGICSEVSGDLHEAYEYYQQTITHAHLPEDREMVAQAKLGRARIALEWHDLGLAEQHVHEAMAIVQEELPEISHQADFQLARLYYARGELASAEQQLASLQVRLQLAPTSEAIQLLSDVRLLQAGCSLQAGDIQKTQRFLDVEGSQEQMAVRIFQARFALAQNHLDAARLQLEHLLTLAREPRHSVEIRILLALASATTSDQQLARHHLQQALSQTRSENLLRPFLSEGEPLVQALRQLVPTLHEPALHAYALTILRAFQPSNAANGNNISSNESLLAEPLSSQEQRVLSLLVAGHSNQEIADELIVSINTVKDHVKHLYRKLGVNTRLQASIVARRLQLL